MEQNGDATTAVEERYESARVCVAIEHVQKGTLILDSGCTFHMCPFKNYVLNYHETDGRRVMTGNNVVCKIVGIRNVNLKLHDGTIRELREVRYVPELKRNLIYLGMLDQMGLSI